MILKEITNKILENICSGKALGKDFNISCDFVSKEFNQIDLEDKQLDQVNEKSFTVLILPKTPKDVTVNGKKIEELFGNDSKGGEK